MAGHWDGEERQDLRRDEGHEQEIARAVQHRQPIGKDKRVIDGAGPLFPHFRERRQKDQFRPALDDFERWRPFDPVFGEQSPKGWGLESTESDVEAQPNHDDAEQEGDTPPPNQELIARDHAEGQHREICQQQSGRHP